MRGFIKVHGGTLLAVRAIESVSFHEQPVTEDWEARAWGLGDSYWRICRMATEDECRACVEALFAEAQR